MSDEIAIQADKEDLGHIKNKVLEGLSKLGGSVGKSCKFAGISTSSYYRLLEDETFKALVFEQTRQAKEIRLEAINDSLFKQATCEEKPNVIAGIFLSKVYGRSHSDPNKQVNDSPPVEAQKAIETTDSISQSSSAVADLMREFVNTALKADQKSKSIEAETIQTKQAQDK